MAWWPFSLGPPSSSSGTPPHPSTAAPPASSRSLDVAAAPETKHVSGPGGATDPDAQSGAEAQTALASWAALLEPFTAGGRTLPEKARTDPSVRQKLVPPTAHLWQYVPFLAKQGTSLTKAFVQHHLFGPPKPSWGVELTLFTTFLREVSSYSHLSSLTRLRSVLELGSLLPTPKDGIVTPISFKVKRRNLRGLLAEADAQESGQREISGEWVTNKRLWRRMTREWTLNKPDEAAAKEGGAAGAKSGGGGSKDGVVCLYLHGGAYYMFSAETHRYLTISVSRYCDARVFAINYRLAPETRFPGQLHDAVSAYMRLTVDLKIPPENIIIAGDSAGGGLALATLMYLRDEGYPLPSGGILMSPWVDLTMSCESWTTNRAYDYLPNPNTEDDHLHPVKCLLGDSIDEYLTHPYVSPLFGTFEGLPPLLIQAGDAEVLRDEITLLAHKAALAGVKVEHEIFEDCVHVFQAFLFLEASRKAFQSQRTFVKHTLPRLRRKALSRASASATPSPDVPAEHAFDFAEVDREVAADAHEVDQAGKAEKASLPSTPQAGGAGRGGAPLPLASDDEEDEDDDEDDDEELIAVDQDHDVDRDTDMSDTPPFAESPLPGGSPWGAGAETPRAARSPVQLPLPADAVPDLSALSSESSIHSPPSSTTSAPGLTTAAPAAADVHQHHHRTVRPILRAYASARDLSMATLRKTHSISSPSSIGGLSLAPAPASRKRRASTITAHPPSSSSPRSTPASPRAAQIALSPRTLGQRRELHVRSSSHPDVAELLRSYMDEREAGEAPRAKTRVWGAERSGRATPLRPGEEEAMDVE
ncbi:hypothetical protein JCM10450v2_002388 [Rhodotorula kratochvilovae]